MPNFPFTVGYKYPNQLHTQLRVGRSSLNSHLYPIGLSNTKSCPCGFANESVEHFLLDCIYYQNIRGQLYQKMEGLLERKVTLNKPLLKQNNVPISILMTIAFSLVQRSGFGSHHNYCDKISCFQLLNRVRFDTSS